MKLLGNLGSAVFCMGVFALCMLSVFIGCGNVPVKPVSDNGTDTQNQRSIVNPCVFNVYMENSGSMYGYVEGVTEFEQSVYSYLSDVKNSEVCSQMNLYYINNEIHQWKQDCFDADSIRDDVRDFIDKLEPDSFEKSGGDKTTTDISDIIGNILKVHGCDTVSILISDFVFSPGSGKNAEEYLINQQIGIKNHFTKQLKSNPETGVLIYRLTSEFKGKYFDRNNYPYYIDQKRPFFIMLVGNSKYLRRLVDNVPPEHIKGSGVLNTFSIEHIDRHIPYEILVMPRIGKFRPDPSSSKTAIINAKPDRKNPGTCFSLSIGTDYSGLILGDEYLTDSRNYDISNKSYTLEVEKSKNLNCTHILKLSLNPLLKQIPRGPVAITLMKKQAEWIDMYTNPDDVGISNITTDKTYGLKYLVNGIYEAYGPEKEFYKLTINIQ